MNTNQEFKRQDFVTHREYGNGIINSVDSSGMGVNVYFPGVGHIVLPPFRLSELSHATLPPAAPTEPTEYEQAEALARKYNYVDAPLFQRNIPGCTYKRGVELVTELIDNRVVEPTGGRYCFTIDKK